jgi:hypothetical protein
MKRDFDLIRHLLKRLEELPFETGETHWIQVDEPFFQFENYSEGQIANHFDLLTKAGFVDGKFESINGEFRYQGITWKGHDFLDSVRDDEIWEKTKAGAKAAGGFTTDLLGDLAKGFIKTKIKSLTGVEL